MGEDHGMERYPAIVKMLAGTYETGVKAGTKAFNSDKNVSVVTNHFPCATW